MLSIDLRGRKALVTGVSSGIGAGIGVVLARAGCDVCGCGLEAADDPGVKHFLDGVTAAGQEAHYEQLDVTDTTALMAFVKQSALILGGLDVVVSNAGANVFTHPEHCSQSQWDHNQQLNLESHWQLVRTAYPWLQAGGKGVCLIITSNHAYATISECFPYNVTKTALLGLTRALAVEWGPEIRVIGIAPGFIETSGGAAWFEQFSDPQQAKTEVERLHPSGRLGTPEEIGALCAFLASDYARFVTGTTYLIDGGRSAVLQDPLSHLSKK